MSDIAVLPQKKRGRGRPPKEVSNHLALDKELQDYRINITKLFPIAVETLEELLKTSTSEKTKEGIAKFIILEGKQAMKYYQRDEDNNKNTVDEETDESFSIIGDEVVGIK